MGGNAFTGLGSADRHSLRDMRCSEDDDRPSEETNRKSLFPADKTLHDNNIMNINTNYCPHFEHMNHFGAEPCVTIITYSIMINAVKKW